MESTASPDNNTEAAAVHIPPRPPSPNNVSTQDTGGSRGGTNANDTAAPLEHEFPQDGLRGLDDDDPPIPPLQVTDHVKEMEGPRLHDGPPEPPHFSHEYDDSIAKSVEKEGPRLIDGPADPPYFPHEHDDSISKGLRNEVERNSSDHPRGSKDYTAHSTEEASAANEETLGAPTVECAEEGGVSFEGTAPPLGPLAEATVSSTAEDLNSPSAGRSTFIPEAYMVEDTEESPGRGTVYEAELIEPQVPHVVPVASEAVPPFYQRKGFVFVVITAALLVIGVVVGVRLLDNSDGSTGRAETSSDDPLTGWTTLSPTSKTTNILTDPPTKPPVQTTDNPSNRPTKPPVQTTNNPSNWPTKPPTVLTVESSQKLLAPDGAADGQFGRSVAMYGDTIVVGVHNNDDGGSAHDYFGASVAVYQDTIVVGAWGDDDIGDQSGSAHVFVRSGVGWTHQTKLLAPDGARHDEFGRNIAIFGDKIVVGAKYERADSVSAYVFVRIGEGWVHKDKLLTPEGAEYGTIYKGGNAVYEDTIVVGTPGSDDYGNNSGSVHIFVQSGDVWSYQAKLLAPDGVESSDFWTRDGYGASAAIYEDTIVIGAPDGGYWQPGSAHVFFRNGEDWTHQVKLLAPDGAAGDSFGWSVAIYGDVIVAGARGDDDSGSSSGSAHVFVRSGGEWKHQAKLHGAAGAPFDSFGGSAAIYEDTIVVCAAGYDDNRYEGSAYVFEV
ncbi:hypothetical protein THAOC_11577 [Thalassiosira oceanica]|uniref:Uncharacterized protein n=1 Tax=Thalassiosira oceanica TaxID=159749 RepID=K0SQV3_THAOC|nr:hypothetical protein THAOC_11577 [Thalassiosira oceanica]|eukprot:EJK67399.1 hypothetical protein THAOC_11577 [Thalassiosira oceanica]